MSLFGNNASGQSTGALFGGNNTTGSTGTTSLTAAKPTGGSIFGGGAATNSGAGGLFGGGSAINSGTGTGIGGLFGGGSATPTSSTSNAGPTASTSTNPAPANSLFGGASFTLPKPTDQANKDTSKPGTSSFFSQPSTSSTTPAAGGLFGAAPKPADNAASGASSSSAPAPNTSLFGGSSLFGKTVTPTAGTSTAPAAGATSPFSLGGNKDAAAPTTSGGLFGATPKPAEKKDDKASTPAPATGLFGNNKPEEKKDAPTTATASLGLSTAPSKEGDKSAASTSLGASTTAPAVAVPPPSMLRGKTIEEIVNKWSNELETHVREFNKFAAEVSMWDRALIENGNNVATLYSHVLAAEREQNEVDQSLNHIEQQQKDLSATLDAYEKVTQEIFGGQGGSLRALDTGPADTERDKNYMLATDLHTHLDDLSGSLAQMIEAVNGLSMPSGSDNMEDPMTQISQILSSHLESLQWIDGAAREVEGKVTEIEKRVKESGHAPSLGANGLKSRSFGLR